jgi:hypothetical protein
MNLRGCLKSIQTASFLFYFLKAGYDIIGQKTCIIDK